MNEENAALAADATDATDALAFIRSIARAVRSRLPRHVDLDELIAAGNLGWVQARQRWRPRAGATFKTFAAYRIRGAMLDLVRRLARQAQDVMTVSFIAAEELLDEHGESAADVTLAGAAGALRCRLGSIATAQWLASSEHRVGEPGIEASPLATAIATERRQHLQTALARLDDEQRELLRLIYDEGLSLAEIGARRDRDKSVICRQHHATLDQLRLLLADAGATPREV
ncbi:MAG: sigma-70 family RNA polymerase sigma factor [Planctomycetes bacterium]|nr:sigma-70 family RNA polymerase sigma factor [Planctomycetota bacterium]